MECRPVVGGALQVPEAGIGHIGAAAQPHKCVEQEHRRYIGDVLDSLLSFYCIT